MANDSLSINTAAVRAVASQITADTRQVQANHAAAWQRMQQHLQDYPAPLQELLFSVINSHQQRMSQTYHWQLAFADALTSAADAFEQTDAAIEQSFSS